MTLLGELCWLKPKRFFDPTGDLDPSVMLDYIIQDLTGEPQLTPLLFDWKEIKSAKKWGDEIVISTSGNAHQLDIRFRPGETAYGEYSISHGGGRQVSEIGEVVYAGAVTGNFNGMPWLHIECYPYKYLVWTCRRGSSSDEKIWLIGLSRPPEPTPEEGVP